MPAVPGRNLFRFCGFLLFFFFLHGFAFSNSLQCPPLFALVAREVSRSYLTLSHKTVNDSKDFVTEGRYNKNKVLLTMRINRASLLVFGARTDKIYAAAHLNNRDRDLSSTKLPAVNEFSVLLMISHC